MVDNLSETDRQRTMRAVQGKGTGLERRLWAMLAGMGLCGWRRNPEGILGNPDVVFETERVALFVDGCFWHGCPHCQRKLPQTNAEYWERKIRRNVERDKKNSQALLDEGWTLVRIWEHELESEQSRATLRVSLRRALAPSRRGPNGCHDTTSESIH